MATLLCRVLASELTKQERGKGCIKYEAGIEPTYGYKPSLVAGIIFTTVFFLSFTVHSVQVFIKRKWCYSALVLGALGIISPPPRTYISQIILDYKANRRQVKLLAGLHASTPRHAHTTAAPSTPKYQFSSSVSPLPLSHYHITYLTTSPSQYR